VLPSSFCPDNNEKSPSYMIVSFFGIRHVMRAYEEIQGYILNGRKIVIHYTYQLFVLFVFLIDLWNLDSV
jgi:RNA recognition motif-containing protein